jgi:hypothetical protein
MGVAGLGWLPLRVMSLAVLRGLRTGRGGGASIIVYYCILPTVYYCTGMVKCPRLLLLVLVQTPDSRGPEGL